MHTSTQATLSRLSRFFTPVKPALEWVTETECMIASAWTRAAHRQLMIAEGYVPPLPDNFDHQIDQFYLWKVSRNPQWVERGVFNRLALKGGNVLELCCGDGFNARNFYSLKSVRVVACDVDPKIIRLARRKNHAPNVSFRVADIRTEMPTGLYENIIWDAAIEYFTVTEIHGILRSIQDRLTPDGILSGHANVQCPESSSKVRNHKFEFSSKVELLRLLAPILDNVLVFETDSPGRRNLYFWASDAVIPFGHNWSRAVVAEKTLVVSTQYEIECSAEWPQAVELSRGDGEPDLFGGLSPDVQREGSAGSYSTAR